MRKSAARGIQLLTFACLAACKTGTVDSLPGPGEVAAPSPASRPPSERAKLDPEIAEIVSRISEERLAGTIKALVAFVTRNSCAENLSPGKGVAAAREFLERELAAIGGMKVARDSFPQPRCAPPVNGINVIGYLPGKDPTRLVLVSGHYDSLALSGQPETRDAERFSSAGGPAPGADDSGSQAALVLEAARVMAGRSYDATVAFVAFAGEEQGLVGSKALAQTYRRYFPNARIEAVLNCDIVGGDASVNDELTLHQYRIYAPGAPRETGRAPDGTNDSTSPSRALMRFVGYWGGHYVPSMVAVPRLREDRIGRGGDQTSFIAEGYPAVRFIETQENVAHQHSPDDVFSNVVPAYLARLTGVVVASAASLARSPHAPRTFEASGNTGRMRFTWSPTQRAHRYVVVARPVGETYYRRRILVPAEQTAFEASATDFGILTVEPLYASVAAVDAEGHESLFANPEFRCDQTACGVPAGALDVTAVVK
jgi:acetylornithine deacetylase/succinyl-diaminopimelate desuccinylase-like protein